jgi:hypothetical protein
VNSAGSAPRKLETNWKKRGKLSDPFSTILFALRLIQVERDGWECFLKKEVEWDDAMKESWLWVVGESYPGRVEYKERNDVQETV